MKKKIILIGIISVIIAVLISISSVLNTVSLKNNYLSTTANNNAIMAGGIVNEIQYSLRYGKSLSNYYEIEDILAKITLYCDYAENIYIVQPDGKILYEKDFRGSMVERSKTFAENVSAITEKKDSIFWVENDIQNILLPITDREGTVIAGLGMSYKNGNLDGEIKTVTDRLFLSNVVPILLGVLLFIFLFLFVKHELKFKRLLAITISVIILSSVLCGVLSYSEYKKAYNSLAVRTADMLSVKIKNDIGSVTAKGIEFEMITGIEDYFEDILENTGLLESISFYHQKPEPASEGVLYYALEGKKDEFVKVVISQGYIYGKLREITVDIIASIVTSMMISAEVIIFILAVITNFRDLRRQRKESSRKTKDVDTLPVGIVRGLFFFFAMFQYMSIAFVPIVMAQIYKPVFGLPFEIVLSIPVTAQIFMSVFSSWICGKIVSIKGWRPVAFFGMSFMVMGALASAFSKEPLLFIGSQIVFGLGLGCAKTAFDIFSVTAPSSEKIEEYTSGTNAGLMTGLSCSAALGAVIAGTFGFSGAFLVMAGFGVFVMILIQIFSVNIIQPQLPTDEKEKPKGAKFDVYYLYYIALLIIPYFFITMFLDYYFPVFADSKGISTRSIGHVFLLSGIATAYVGSYLCNRLSKIIRTVLLMSGMLLVLGAFLGFFSVNSSFVAAVAFVLFLGVVDGIMPSLQNRYILSLDISKRLGVSRVIGIEGAFIGIIRGISPLIFGFAMLRGTAGLLVSSGIVMAAAVLFFMAASKKYTQKGNETI